MIVGGAAVGEPQTLRATGSKPVLQAAAFNYGHILGVVIDAAGAPLDGALISATGPSGIQLAVCDAEGRFEFRSLLPGAYLLRAHSPGLLDTQRHLVEVLPGERAHQALTLRRGAAQAPAPSLAFLTAGFVGRGDQAEEEAVTAESPDEAVAPAPHDHSEKAWRIRRARRSVLKDTASQWVEARQKDASFMGQPVSLLSRAVDSSTRLAENLFSGIPLSGQLHLLTRADVGRPRELLSSDYWPGQIAYLTVGAPTSRGQWSIEGAVTTGDARSWVLAGSYEGDPDRTHALDLGLSYSVQRAEDDSSLTLATSKANSRAVASVRFFDTWSVSSRLGLGYGASYSRYDYLTQSGLFSPRMSVSVAPVERTRIRMDVARSMIAPGEEEFLPPAATGIWLPPERTFAPLAAREPLRVERAHRIEVAVDQTLSNTYAVSGRRFYSDVEDQLVTLFNVKQWPSGADHYYLASAGAVETDGWGVGFKRATGGRWHGTVEYSITRARWLNQPSSLLARYVPSAVRQHVERIHDLTTTIETTIPETDTHVFAVYRVNSAFARSEPDADAPGLGARFDLRVKQSLPFSPVEGSSWEVLVMVRSLFRDASDSASPYDELFVVSPPRQFVGGLVVNF